MKLGILAIVLSVVAACGREPRRMGAESVRARATPATSGTPSTPDSMPTVRDIYIDSVTVSNPMVIYGRARTFENAISARVLDAHDDTIGEVHGMSTGGEMGKHNPFA